MRSQAFQMENVFMKVCFQTVSFWFTLFYVGQEFSCDLKCTSLLLLEEYITKDKLKSCLIDA